MQFCCGEMHVHVPRIRLSLDNKLLRKRFVCTLLKLLLLMHNYATLLLRMTSGDGHAKSKEYLYFSVQSYDSSMIR